MKYASWWIASFYGIILLWHQCGEDAGVFWYRIVQGAVIGVRERALVSIQTRRQTPGTGFSWSNRYAASSTPFMTSKD